MEAGVINESSKNRTLAIQNDNSENKLDDGADKGRDWHTTQLLGDFANSIKDAVSSTLPKDFPTLEILGFSSKEEESATDKALRVAKDSSTYAQNQVDKYYAFRDTNNSHPAGDDVPGPGNYQNEDGSSYDIDTRGDLKKVSIPPSERFPKGLQYEGTYNDQHELIAMKISDGRIFTRTSPANENGFAFWEGQQGGKKIQYSTRGPFVGKISMEPDGIQTMIGHDKQNPSLNTKWAGTILRRETDGTETKTTLTGNRTQTTGMESKTIFTDGTETINTFKFDTKNKLVKDEAIAVKAADGDWKSVVKNDKVVEHHEHLLAKDRLRQMSADLDKNPQLHNLHHISVQDKGSKVHVSVNNYHATNRHSIRPGTVIDGIKPSHTHVAQNLNFDASHSNGKLALNHINGMTGYGAKLGPLGRRWWSGSSSVDAVTMGPGYMQSHSAQGWMTAHSQHLTGDAQQSVHPATIAHAGSVLDMFKLNADHLSVHKSSPRNFNLDIVPDKIHRDKPKEGELPLQCASRIKAQVSYSEHGHKISNIQGVSFLGKNVTEIRTEPDRAGQLKVSINYIDNQSGKQNVISFSEQQAKAALAMVNTKRS